MDIHNYIERADSIVSNHFAQYAKKYDTVGVLLSGGIDSTLITSYVFHHFPQARIFSMGTDQTKDRQFVDIFVQQEKKEYEWIDLNDEVVQAALPAVRSILKDVGVVDSTMQLSLGCGYYLIFKRANELGIHTIVTGQGPDILFAGYHKYKSISSELINEEIKKDLVLLETDIKRDSGMAAHFGITLVNPYLEKDFIEFTLTIPSEYKVKEGVEKFMMREWGKKRGLPNEIVSRPKKAFQYSTGIQKTVKRLLEFAKE